VNGFLDALQKFFQLREVEVGVGLEGDEAAESGPTGGGGFSRSAVEVPPSAGKNYCAIAR
jgi:hypothetical protein